MPEPMTYLGVNHVALVCRDMAETVDFYENVLGMPLVKTLGLPGEGQHFFFDCGGGATLAFMWFKNAPPVAPGIASQHPDVAKNGAETAIASMNHLAIFGTDYLELIAVQKGATKGRLDLLEYPIGLNGLVFGSEDSAVTYETLHDSGVPVDPPAAGLRAAAGVSTFGDLDRRRYEGVLNAADLGGGGEA